MAKLIAGLNGSYWSYTRITGLPDSKMSIISTGSFQTACQQHAQGHIGAARPLTSPKVSLSGTEEMCLRPGTAMACQPGCCSTNNRGPDPAGAEICLCAWWHHDSKPSLSPPLPHQGLLPAPTAWSCLGATNARGLANTPVWMDQCLQHSMSHSVWDTRLGAR